MLPFTSLGGENKPPLLGQSEADDCSFCRTHPVHNEDLPDTEPLLKELGRYGNRVEVTETPARGQRQKQVLLNSEEEAAEAAVEPEEELTSAHSPQRDVQAAGRQRNRSVRRKKKAEAAFTGSKSQTATVCTISCPPPHTHTQLHVVN